MEEWLKQSTELAVLATNAVALVAIAFGTLEACVAAVRAVAKQIEVRLVWLHYGRWLVAGLTFQLAADILATSIEQDWEGIARLAAIAVVRTFLNFFLERDLKEILARDSENRQMSSS